MHQYRDLISRILKEGTVRNNRTGVDTVGIFGHQMRFDLTHGFPMVTGKYTPFKTMAKELLWFISGSDNVRPLQEQGVKIWNEWAAEDGSLGPVYGYQWRNWGGDQLLKAIEKLKRKPDDRRIIVSAWNVAELDEMALPPCHMMFHFSTQKVEPFGRGLSCLMYQRSCDVFLGVPFNIASYSLLTHMVAQVVGMKPLEFIWVGGDCHLYVNHLKQVEEYMQRPHYQLPTLVLNEDVTHIDNFTIDDMYLENYEHGDHISAPIAV